MELYPDQPGLHEERFDLDEDGFLDDAVATGPGILRAEMTDDKSAWVGFYRHNENNEEERVILHFFVDEEGKLRINPPEFETFGPEEDF